MFLLAMAMLLLLPLQARAQDSPQQSVDLTTRMARTTHDGLRKIKNQPSRKVDVVASQTDVATVQTAAADNAIDSFISLDEVWTDATDWTEYTFTLPEGTKYFAIRHTAQDIFGLLLDDVTFERNASAPVGYNIYVDGELVGSTTDTNYDLPATLLPNGEQTLAVTAVYEGGKESAPATAVIDNASGISEITLDGQPVDVYTIDGRLVRRQATSLEGLKGIYLIGNKKVFVK